MSVNILNHPFLFISAMAFLLNVPCGYVRERCQKFSVSWFFWIHASIPFLIYFRTSLDVSGAFIPVSIFFAVLGQIVGAKFRRQKISKEDRESYERIYNLGLKEAHASNANESNTSVVLMNMGGPRTNEDVPEFQKRLFEDPLLIRFPLSFLLQPFFAWLLIKLRGKETQKRYKLIGGGSPIFDSTYNQTKAFRQELAARGHTIDVIFSFNYSEPLPEQTVFEIKEKGSKYILPLSLYPQYSKATTGSNIYYLEKAAQKIYPDVTFLDSPQYHLHAGYIRAFEDRIKEQLKDAESLDDFYLLFSAHGLPLYFVTEGDPYAYQISQTVGAIVNNLGRKDKWSISYQSAVGPLQWLKPSTDAVLKALADRGVKKVIVVPIAFVTDHIETLCEIDIEYREEAEKLGITDFRMSRAVECHPSFIEALADTVESYLGLSSKKELNKTITNPASTEVNV